MVAQSVVIIVVGILAIIELRMEYNIEKLKIENQKLLEKVDTIEKDEKENLKINKFFKNKLILKGHEPHSTLFLSDENFPE